MRFYDMDGILVNLDKPGPVFFNVEMLVLRKIFRRNFLIKRESRKLIDATIENKNFCKNYKFDLEEVEKKIWKIYFQ